MDTDDRLAEAAVHSTGTVLPLLGKDWPQGIESTSDTSPPSASKEREQWSTSYPPRQTRSGKSLLQIYAEVLDQDEFKPVPYDKNMMIGDRLVTAGKESHDALHKIAKEWSLSDEELGVGIGGWEKKVEEIAILVTLLACGSGRKGKAPRVDFFMVCPLLYDSLILNYAEIRCTHSLRRSFCQPTCLSCLFPNAERSYVPTS